jgi:aerobic-type carbon monoxide dehydrogenase small subunit (CoxS/CutS family)
MTSTVVNSKTCEISELGASLLAFFRSELGLTGVKPGCGRGHAGLPFLARKSRSCSRQAEVSGIGDREL